MSKSCPRFQFEITYELTTSYCKNCEGICNNNKNLHGAIDPYLLDKFPLDMLDDFTEETQKHLNEILNGTDIVCSMCEQHFSSEESIAEHKCSGKPLVSIQVRKNKQNLPYLQVIWPKNMLPASWYK